MNISAKGMQLVFTTMLILAILRHALNDPHFKAYRDRWMLEGTLTALLTEFYNIPESIQFSESDFRSAVSCRNHTQLVRYGFETINERNFDLNTCRVYASDPHHSLSIVGARDRVRQVAFYLQDRTLAEEINSPSTIAYLQPSRSCGNIVCDSSRDNEEEDGDARNMLIRSPPRLLRKRRMTRSYEKEQKKRNMPSVDEIRKKYGARKSTRVRCGEIQSIANQVVRVVQPPTSCKVWFRELLDFHGDITEMLASHQPIAIEDQAVSKLIRNELDQLMLELNQSDEQERKKAARAHVSRNAIGSLNCIYWYSSDAINLFSPTSDHDTNIYIVLVERVALLGAAIQSSETAGSGEAFFQLIEGNPKDLSEFSLSKLSKLKAKFVCVKLVTMEAMAIMGSGENGQNFEKCCRNVVEKVSAMRCLGMKQYPSDWQSVRKWHAEFRTHGKFLRGLHPSRYNNPLPRILVDYTDQALAIRKFIKTELEGITAETVRAYIHETILPNIAVTFINNNSGEWDDAEREVQSFSIPQVLSYYGMKTLSIATTLRWMNALGMKYDDRRKNYYVDGHEREDVVLSRWKFISTYLRREVQMCRWVQVSGKKLKELMKTDDSILAHHGYNFKNDKNESMWEYHVDSHKIFQEIGACVEIDGVKYGGNLSVRKDEDAKIIISLGHDECIFNMFSFTKKCWNGCEGEQPIIPKDNGQGIMYSCIQSREFGFGFRKLTIGEVTKLNRERRTGKKYIDPEAAKVARGSDIKKEFTVKDNPFVRSFLYGANKEGYWTYDHLITQLEDCMDMLHTLYDSTKYEFQFLVDHSCGHDRQRPDGLNVKVMNKLFGGKQPIMHDSDLTDGCIGIYNPRLQLGSKQSFIFKTEDDGPFYLHDVERTRLRNDLIHSKFVNISKSKLLKEIFQNNIIRPGEVTVAIGDKTFRVDHEKKQLYAEDTPLLFAAMTSVCRRRNLTFEHLLRKDDSFSLLQNLIINSVPTNQSRFSCNYQGRNQTIEISGDRNTLKFVKTPASNNHIRNLCRVNNIPWRNEEKLKELRTKVIEKTKKDLINELTSAGHHVPKKDRGKKAGVIPWATKYGIELTKIVPAHISETWVGKPKGMLQIAWERGLLDLNRYCVEDFSDKGKLDDCGNVIQDTSLDYLLSKCIDFIEEKSLLQLNLDNLGAQCFHSPKFHCELAGEGIEYSWGVAKLAYRKLKKAEKNTIGKFHSQVQLCLSHDHLTINRVRLHSKRARDYMVTYFIMSIEGENGTNGEISLDEMKPCAVSASKIEQMRRTVKTHRAAIDFDKSFCKAKVVVKIEKVIDN